MHAIAEAEYEAAIANGGFRDEVAAINGGRTLELRNALPVGPRRDQ